MADNLPLLPDKESLCYDVKSVLQEVFRESDCLPHLDGLSPAFCQAGRTNNAFVETDIWIKHLSLESAKLNNHEDKLQKEYAKRLAKDSLPNIYKLRSILVSEKECNWKEDIGLLERKDLKPTLQQDATREESLWIKNILNGSSENFSSLKITGSKINAKTSLKLPDEISVQSVSWGEIASSSLPPSPLPSLSTPLPDYIICIPPQLQFINFKIGQLYTQSLRFLNVSKFEMRISIRPPKHRELDVQLCSRLVITSGSDAELKIHFRPNDVRVLCDKLLVRVSSGQILCIPIECYMEPPMLDIIVPTLTPRLSSSDTIITVQDVLDLGAKLLGDLHHLVIILRCGEHHASFFLLSEDAWLDYSVEVAINTIDKIPSYGVASDCFFISPVRWTGGGTIRGIALCRANSPGLHTAVLRILCSTAIVRPLHLVADALLYCTKHVTLQAQDKDYDICSEDDPACEYYVHLGTSFPKGPLSASVAIFNHSPVSYNYYWSVRPWGVCSCWKQPNDSQESVDHDNDLCPGALQAKLKTMQENYKQTGDEASLALRVEQARGRLSPRHDVVMTVSVPDVGETLGLHRAVLMLVLTDIPKESFPHDCDPMIINVNIVEEEAIPGLSPRWSREVCEVVCAEMEVWWEVVPIRFALDPPLLLVPYSRRVKAVTVNLRATQLYGVTSVKALWEMKAPVPASLHLLPGQSSFTTATLVLEELPNEFSNISYIRLTSEKAEWSVSTSLQLWSSKRAIILRQSRVWLGVVPPCSPVAAELFVCNDTHQHIHWCVTCHRWYRERHVAKACVNRPPCIVCCSHACTCSSLTPHRGYLNSTQETSIQYQAYAPDTDGCVALLVQVRCMATDTFRARSPCASQARACLISYRVLSPRVTITVLSLGGDESNDCDDSVLNNSAGNGERVSSTLRPSAALVAGDCTRYRLQVTNLTPIPTLVKWEEAIEAEDDLKVTFIPKEFELPSYSRVNVMVILEARRVTARRLFVRRASVANAHKPLYLLIDLAISGVEVIAEFPIGGDKNTDSFVSIKMMQKDLPWNMSTKPLCPAELFAEDDRRRALQRVNICYCRYKMVYIPPKKEPRPPPSNPDDNPPVEIVEEPPPLTRVCPCAGRVKPVLPDDSQPFCLQFFSVPLRKVRSRTINLRNVSGLDACWRTAVRRYPREHVRTECTDQWSGDVREPGVVIACSPVSGTVRARSAVKISVSVYADCWGLYYDQILIQPPTNSYNIRGFTRALPALEEGVYVFFKIEDMEPLVVDVWIEAIGLPLCFALQHKLSTVPVLWMSKSDSDRVISLTNTSRADLNVFVYILRDNEYPQEELPFRLYLRLFDILPRICPCLTAFDSKSIIEEESRGSSFCLEDMDTGVELFLAPDYGVQDEAFYQVNPSTFEIRAQATTSLKVRLLSRHEHAPGSSILFRCLPVNMYGNAWCRPPPAVQRVSLQEAARRSCLQIACSEIRVALCALDMPLDDVIRIRKRFNVRNVGEGFLETTAITESPWRLDVSRNVCYPHCTEINRTYSDSTKIYLPPRSSIEMVVVLTLKTNETWPMPGESYLPRTITSTALRFYDHEDVMLLSIPLIMDLDMPVLTTQPEHIDFGFIPDGNTRKSYFFVKHSSSSAVIDLVTDWSGDENFRIWPPSFSLRPGVSECVYVQYTACWMRGKVSAGTVRVRSLSERRQWCGVAVGVRACVCRTRPDPPADHTDDIHLMP